jgi:hypothetical protein
VVGVGLDGYIVPRVLVGAVDGVEILAVGALQFARDVVLSAVSGAANIGAEALTATVAGARSVVSAASQTVGDIASTAQSTFLATIENARHLRRGPARMAPRRPPTSMTGEAAETATSVAGTARRRPARRRTRTPSHEGPSVAA